MADGTATKAATASMHMHIHTRERPRTGNYPIFRRPPGLADGLAQKDPALPTDPPWNSPQQRWVPRSPTRSGIRRARKRITNRRRTTQCYGAARRETHSGPVAMVRRAVPRPSRLLLAVVLLAVLALALTACGGKESGSAAKPKIGVKGDTKDAASDLGFPAFATKNTTRVGGADSAANAAGVAQAVYSAGSKVTRPKAGAPVASRDWRIRPAPPRPTSPPLPAPLVYSGGRGTPAARKAPPPR